MNNDLMITTHDLVRSAAVLAAAVGAAGLLYTGLNGMLGFVWASLAGLGAGAWEHGGMPRWTGGTQGALQSEQGIRSGRDRRRRCRLRLAGPGAGDRI